LVSAGPLATGFAALELFALPAELLPEEAVVVVPL
jgi:hypothetical protein